MDTARLLTHMPILMGFTSAALIILLLLFSLLAPSPTLCIPSHYSLPALKSMCVDYACSMWSLFSRAEEPFLIITPRNLFLLVNLIILLLLISLHFQQHAPAAGKSSSREKRRLHAEKLTMWNEKQAVPLQTPDEASSARIVDSDSTNGPDGEQIVLEEDGRLRLIAGPIQANGSEADSSGRINESVNDSDGEKIVVEADGRLRLIEAVNGSDAEKIVLEEDGRLRLVGRPLPAASHSVPQKSLSTGDNYDTSDVNNSNLNYDMQGLNFNYDNKDSSLSQNLNQDDARQYSGKLTNNKSSPLIRTSSKPMRVKKCDSLDATWKAISGNNKGRAANANSRHLIRQSSRQDFKPSRGGNIGLMKRAPHHHHHHNNNNNNNSNNNNNKVRREPSISQEELNAKVESFIAKFNEQIRIQRQQSLVSYMQMVDRGA